MAPIARATLASTVACMLCSLGPHEDKVMPRIIKIGKTVVLRI